MASLLLAYKNLVDLPTVLASRVRISSSAFSNEMYPPSGFQL